MNWRTGVRIGLAAVGLGVAGTVYYHSRTGPPPPELPGNAPTLDPSVSLLGGTTLIIDYKDGKPSLELTAKSATSFSDGRKRFEDASVKGLGENTFTLRAGVIDTKGPAVAGERPTQYELGRRFIFEASDGMVVESEQGTYDNGTGVMTMPGAVTFKRGRISGTATGAIYERDNDTITLLDAAQANVTADAQGRGAAIASSKRMKLVRGQHSLQMDENSRISGESQNLSSHQAIIAFTDDDSAMKYLELTGAAKVEPLPGAAPGQPSMSADKLTMSFQPDGLTLQHATLTGRAVLGTTDTTGTRLIRASWIDFFTGTDGRTLTKLNARDKVVVEIPATATATARSITAATLAATGDEKRGLTSARFDGNPCFQEDPSSAGRGRGVPADPGACAAAGRSGSAGRGPAAQPDRRVGTAVTLVLALGGQLDAIQEARFQQNARFVDGDTSAHADLAIYDDAKDVLLLRPAEREPRSQSGVSTPDLTVDAVEIDLNLTSENMNARGGVKTRTVQKSGQNRAAAGSLFGGDGPVFGTADTLVYVRESGKATYTGSAKTRATLKHDQTDISAAQIEFTQDTNHLTATGQVDSSIFMSAPAKDTKGTAKPQKYTVQSESLTYDDVRRTAVYEAPLVVLTTEDGNRTEARKLTFELAKETRTLDRMRAETDVFATMPGGYEATGDLLVYRADTDTYTISGKPARVKGPGEKPGDCKLWQNITLELDRKTDTVSVPVRSTVSSEMKPIACTDSIRPKR